MCSIHSIQGLRNCLVQWSICSSCSQNTITGSLSHWSGKESGQGAIKGGFLEAVSIQCLSALASTKEKQAFAGGQEILKVIKIFKGRKKASGKLRLGPNLVSN